MKLTNKNILRLFLLCTCLLVVFLSRANAALIELLPADDAKYHYYCSPPSPFVPCPSASLSRGYGLGAYYYYQLFYNHSLKQLDRGIIEFDLSGIAGLFTSGQMQATLVLTLKSGTPEFDVFDMPDEHEDGVIVLTDVTGGSGISSGLHEGSPITIDVTQAVEHDLFGQNQTAFSGFILSNYCYFDESGEMGMCQTPGANFYDRTDSVNTPKLIISSTATLIHLSSFTATPKAGEVTLNWRTESEIDNAGFNVYRSTSEDGEYEKINSTLIPAQGSATQGAAYAFIDSGLKNGKTCYYKLEDVDLYGTATMHGPVSAVPRWVFGIFRK